MRIKAETPKTVNQTFNRKLNPNTIDDIEKELNDIMPDIALVDQFNY